MTNVPQACAYRSRARCGYKNERSDLARLHGGFFSFEAE
jgi:hypothetical protein